jgi:hypothetical protein
VAPPSPSGSRSAPFGHMRSSGPAAPALSGALSASSERLPSAARHVRSGRHPGVGVGAELAPAFGVRSERPPARPGTCERPLRSERSRGTTARSVVVLPHRSSAMRASMAVAVLAVLAVVTAGGRGVRRLSRRAVVDDGETPRRPNLSLLFASVVTDESSRPTARFGRLGCHRPSPPTRPTDYRSHRGRPAAPRLRRRQETPPHICTNGCFRGTLWPYEAVERR